MLTIEMLRQNPVLAPLSDTVLQAIATMSQNDENTVIGTKLGAMYGQYDSDILGITGIAKNNGEKSSDYAKRVLTQYKSSVTEVNTVKKELETSKQKIKDLEEKVAAGSADDAIKQQLKDAKTQVSQLQSQLQAKEADILKVKTEYETKLKNTKIDFAFNQAASNIKFKDTVPESIKSILLASAKAEIMAKGTPDFIDDEKGNSVFVLRDKDGNILNNVKNNLNPYTIAELLNESSLKDVIASDIKFTGSGTKPIDATKPTVASDIDLSSVKSQIEADTAIENYLLSKGYTRDSMEFSEQSLKLREENNVSSLPIR